MYVFDKGLKFQATNLYTSTEYKLWCLRFNRMWKEDIKAQFLTSVAIFVRCVLSVGSSQTEPDGPGQSGSYLQRPPQGVSGESPESLGHSRNTYWSAAPSQLKLLARSFFFLIYMEKEMCIVLHFVKFMNSLPNKRKGILQFYKEKINTITILNLVNCFLVFFAKNTERMGNGPRKIPQSLLYVWKVLDFCMCIRSG